MSKPSLCGRQKLTPRVSHFPSLPHPQPCPSVPSRYLVPVLPPCSIRSRLDLVNLLLFIDEGASGRRTPEAEQREGKLIVRTRRGFYR